jgi:hypothetical protein
MCKCDMVCGWFNGTQCMVEIMLDNVGEGNENEDRVDEEIINFCAGLCEVI